MSRSVEVPARHRALLEELGVGRTQHSKRTLLDHLVGTRALLRTWGNPGAICTAGLFHSIYGTYVFARPSAELDQRPEISAIIGKRAERLVYLFCVCDRATFFADPTGSFVPARDLVNGETLGLLPATVSALLEIEAANIVEQLPRRGRETRASFAWYRDAFERRRDRISAAAAEAVLAALDEMALPAAAAAPPAAAVEESKGAQ